MSLLKPLGNILCGNNRRLVVPLHEEIAGSFAYVVAEVAVDLVEDGVRTITIAFATLRATVVEAFCYISHGTPYVVCPVK